MIKLDGFKELEQAFKDLPDAAAKRVLQGATRSAMTIGKNKVMNAAPRGDKVSSVQKKYGYGHLYQELKVKNIKRGRRLERGVKLHTGRAFWAYFYEKGTRKQPARPFFDKAIMAAEKDIFARLNFMIKKGLEREWSKMIRGGKK